MKFELSKSIEILSRTPFILETMLANLSDDWLKNNEGDDTWSPYDVVGHLIHGEKTDWLVRSRIILSNAKIKMFEPFDRFAQMGDGKDKTIEDLLIEFKTLRTSNLRELKSMNVQETDLIKRGIHPELGECNLGQLLSTWVVHDLGHIAQISRVMAKQYKMEVGPWKQYLKVIQD